MDSQASGLNKFLRTRTKGKESGLVHKNCRKNCPDARQRIGLFLDADDGLEIGAETPPIDLSMFIHSGRRRANKHGVLHGR